MTRRRGIDPPDVVASIPLLCCGLLLLGGFLRKLLGLPVTHSDATFVALFVVTPLGFMATGVIGFHTLLVTLSDLADSRWNFGCQKRLLGRAVLCGAGYLLLLTQLLR